VLHYVSGLCRALQGFAGLCRALQGLVVCFSVLQCVTMADLKQDLQTDANSILLQGGEDP